MSGALDVVFEVISLSVEVCDFWHVVVVVFFDIALWNVFGSCGCNDHIEPFDVDVNAGDVVGIIVWNYVKNYVILLFVIGEFIFFALRSRAVFMVMIIDR